MNTVNYNDTGAISDSTYVGVDKNRLVVTTRPEDFGTFTVTTGENYTTIPYAKATSFRINNITGKIVGVRRRHKTLVVDNLDDTDYSEWAGSGNISKASEVLEGARTASISGLKYRPLNTEVMLDGSEVEVSFKTPIEDGYSITIAVWDSVVRVTTPGALPSATFTATSANTSKSTVYKVIFRLFPTTSKFDAILEYNGREEVTSQAGGQFGTNNMQDSVVSVESDRSINVDPVVYQQKVNYGHELMFSTSSYSYPCNDNISEYEVINLGSDAMNYSDNSDSISLTGFYGS